MPARRLCGFSARAPVGFPMPPIPTTRSMHRVTDGTTYAIAWQGIDGNRFVGSLRLEPGVLRLEGRGRGGLEELRTVAYEAVSLVELRRDNGGRELALRLRGDDLVVLTSLDRPGSLGELTDHLRNLTASPHG